MTTPTASLLRVMALAAATGSAFVQAGEEPECPDLYPDNRHAVSTAIGNSTLGIAYASTRDISGRMYRNRAGIRPGATLTDQEVAVAPAYSAKGGMGSAKGGAKVAAVSVPSPNKWEIFGSLFYYTEDHDGDSYRRRSKKKDDKYDKYGGFGPGAIAGVAGGTAESSLDVYGGAIGIEHHFNREWSIGFGVSAATGDLDMGGAGSADVDSVSVIPYLSYYRTDALGSADLWAGLMYAYGMHSYETRRFTGGGIATGSPDADTHEVEFTAGLNFGEDEVVHGPYAGLRYITGTVDAYTEVGPGATYFGEQDVDSLVSILGYQISWRWRGSAGYWVPQIRAAWEHEFEDGNVSAFGIPIDTRDEDIAVIGAGFGHYWDNGWNLGLEYEGRFGSETEAHYGGVKAGKEF